MFDSIAPRYDLLNRILSLGIDRRWRRKAIRLLASDRPTRILDIATGTADVAIEALRLRPDEIVGVDISEEMLRIGREKLRRLRAEDRVSLVRAPSESLPFEDNRFDAVTVAFGVRNFEDLSKGLSEMCRVLVPGGRVVVLEFSTPEHFPLKQIFGAYFSNVLPRIGSSISGDRGAYQYLHDSVREFPSGQAFLDVMREAGFDRLQQDVLTFGIASLYSGRRPE
jgi:demethylmenaquinone methyltransferase/2-methoxy-6-polyprenyl-1,4-benzoquinol methylase